MNLDDVEKLIVLMERHELTELQVKEAGWEFLARRGDKNQPVMMAAPLAQAAPPIPAPVASPAASAPAAPSVKLKEIRSPIVGTMYRAPAPDQPPYKEVGDHVNTDDIVCLVEAMKVMNEIKAGVRGIIRKVLIENANPVEYDQVIFLVEIGE